MANRWPGHHIIYWIIYSTKYWIFLPRQPGSKLQILSTLLVRSMVATVGPARATEGSRDGVDPEHWRALKGVGCVLGRLAGALAPAGSVFGIIGNFRRGASANLGGIAEIINGGPGGPAGHLAGDTLEHTGRVLVRVGDGHPVRSVSRNPLHVYLNFKWL